MTPGTSAPRLRAAGSRRAEARLELLLHPLGTVGAELGRCRSHVPHEGGETGVGDVVAGQGGVERVELRELLGRELGEIVVVGAMEQAHAQASRSAVRARCIRTRALPSEIPRAPAISALERPAKNLSARLVASWYAMAMRF